LWQAKFVFIALAVAGVGFLSGVVYERETTEPLIHTIVKEVPVEVPVIVEVEKIVEIEVLVKYPLELCDFESEEELKQGLKAREERRVIFLRSDKYDCDDAARAMVEDAVEDGYWMWLQIIDDRLRSPVSGRIINKTGKVHALTSVIIGNDFYYIEPAFNEYWLMWSVD